MPVEVSLERLVLTYNARSVWPEDFDALAKGLEGSQQANPVAWAATADWCSDHEEHDLAAAFAWVGRRIGAGIKVTTTEANRYTGVSASYRIDGLPTAVAAAAEPVGSNDTLAGAVAKLAGRLRAIREDIG